MSRVFSFRDLQRIPELSKYTETEMLDIEMDGMINKYLAQLGFNVNAAVLYEPAQHRDLSGHVEIGYRAVGEVTHDPAWLEHPLCNTTERIIFRARTDMSLAKELARMQCSGINWSEDNGESDPDFPESLVEKDFEDTTTMLDLLRTVRDAVRGNPYNEYGALKTPQEYQMQEVL